MKFILPGLSFSLFVVFVGLLSLVQAGETGMGGEAHGYATHGYGGMMGYGGLWVVYGLIKVGVVGFGLWLLLRIARAVEKIAGSQS